ncbi:J domain-containing protein [Streptosporangium sp. G12]
MLSKADLRACKRCHAEVRATTSAAGKTFLVDPNPVDPAGPEAATANTAVLRDSHGVLRSRRVSVEQPLLRWERLMVPHAATCKPAPKPPPRPPRRTTSASDFHTVLGVPLTATPAEIKKAYRRLARQLHPDVTPDPAAAERFKRITHAYDVLTGRTR